VLLFFCSLKSIEAKGECSTCRTKILDPKDATTKNHMFNQFIEAMESFFAQIEMD
jgi:hypothetical protein